MMKEIFEGNSEEDQMARHEIKWKEQVWDTVLDSGQPLYDWEKMQGAVNLMDLKAGVSMNATNSILLWCVEVSNMFIYICLK